MAAISSTRVSGRKPSQHQPGRAAAGLIHWPDRFGRGVYATAARRQPVGLAGRRARSGGGDGSNPRRRPNGRCGGSVAARSCVRRVRGRRRRAVGAAPESRCRRRPFRCRRRQVGSEHQCRNGYGHSQRWGTSGVETRVAWPRALRRRFERAPLGRRSQHLQPSSAAGFRADADGRATLRFLAHGRTGAQTTRNPMLPLEKTGSTPPRRAERQLPEPSFQPPPRMTRFGPLVT